MKQSDILQHCIDRNIAFFSYRMPQSNDIVTGIQTSSNIKNFVNFELQDNGFIVSPFDSNSSAKALVIEPDIYFTNNEIESKQLELLLSLSFETVETSTATHQASKSEYLEQANTLIDKLNKKEIDKVVLSRAINNVDINKEIAVTLFEQLTKTYPHAFVSIFQIPGQCVWVGATPETLLKITDDGIRTMSLAGTKSVSENVKWTNKEREEQQMVSDYVEHVLDQFSFTDIEKNGPINQNAGNVCHLMTVYNCKGKLSGMELTNLINALHPTPAVCGIPKEASLQLINSIELHDREYYAGYLGPINAVACNLFVNLRCMKLTDKGVVFFVGGGLTAQSVPESEWGETCMKLETLSKVIGCK